MESNSFNTFLGNTPLLILAILVLLLLAWLLVAWLRKGRKSETPESSTEAASAMQRQQELEPPATEVEITPAAEQAEPQDMEAQLETRARIGTEAAIEIEPPAARTPLPSEAAPPLAEPRAPAESLSVFARVKQGLTKTRSTLTDGIAGLFSGGALAEEDILEEIESLLLVADVGIEATAQVMASLNKRLSRQELAKPERLREVLKQELQRLLEPCAVPLQPQSNGKPFVILMVGVNGAGKTTTIGKLAKYYQAQGRKVMLAAGDTFRAAAVEQLQEWGERNQVPVVAQHTGADSASVIFDALQSAQARKMDILIADTAGRLQNKDHLMAELAKVKRVMAKLDPDAPQEVMLVLDAGTGQNALSQAKLFNETVGVTGISLTKLDGTAKGGVIFAVAKQLGMPIRFIGVGEKIDDLKPFDAHQFVDALLD